SRLVPIPATPPEPSHSVYSPFACHEPRPCDCIAATSSKPAPMCSIPEPPPILHPHFFDNNFPSHTAAFPTSLFTSICILNFFTLNSAFLSFVTRHLSFVIPLFPRQLHHRLMQLNLAPHPRNVRGPLAHSPRPLIIKRPPVPIITPIPRLPRSRRTQLQLPRQHIPLRKLSQRLFLKLRRRATILQQTRAIKSRVVRKPQLNRPSRETE